MCYVLWFSYIYGQSLCCMMLRVSFPGMFCSFLFLDNAKAYYQNYVQ